MENKTDFLTCGYFRVMNMTYVATSMRYYWTPKMFRTWWLYAQSMGCKNGTLRVILRPLDLAAPPWKNFVAMRVWNTTSSSYQGWNSMSVCRPLCLPQRIIEKWSPKFEWQPEEGRKTKWSCAILYWILDREQDGCQLSSCSKAYNLEFALHVKP